MTNPKATLHMANGTDIVIELLPQAAPNTVNSFIYAASHGYLDHHAIERIVPGNWVDVSYTAFGHKELQYLIPNEFTLHPEITPLDSHPGCVCMGGYGEAGLASCEFFFPLRDCPDHKGTYPVFGKVLSGMDEIRRIATVKTVPVDFPIPGVEVNKPEGIAWQFIFFYSILHFLPKNRTQTYTVLFINAFTNASADLEVSWKMPERR